MVSKRHLDLLPKGNPQLALMRSGELYSLAQVVVILGLSEATIRKMREDGMPVMRPGKRNFVLSDDLFEAMKKGTAQ